jgi:hypothetical protein
VCVGGARTRDLERGLGTNAEEFKTSGFKIENSTSPYSSPVNTVVESTGQSASTVSL